MKKITVLMFALLLPLPALADRSAAKACADDLSPSAQEIYRGSLQAMQSGQDPKEAIAGQVKSLVASGSLSQENAKDVAQAAVQCMMMFKQ